MQLAILLVLILIAVILARWLIGVIVVLIAAYGLWIVAAFALTIIIGLVVLAVYALREGLFSSREVSSSTERMIAEANRKHREKEAAQREKTTQAELLQKEDSGESKR